ncbi:MAG: GMC family oxidoreductase [Burkholderiaceae bacterium]|nr:MAG: GMC family oxidoreductase [Burkholderiaceae bacterium]
MKADTVTGEYDVIVVGSGPAGATVARDLSKKGKRVLILERGPNKKVSDTIRSIASVIRSTPIGEKMKVPSVSVTGGASAIYFGICERPDLGVFNSYGVDLSSVLDEAESDLPITEIPDHLLGPQQIRLREIALNSGLPWKKHKVLAYSSMIDDRYKSDARWNASQFISDAIESGAVLQNFANAKSILHEQGRAIGISYSVGIGNDAPLVRAYAERIILSAGAAATPKLLRENGLADGIDASFYCHPGLVVFGCIQGLGARESFVATMSAELDRGLALGDANFAKSFYRMYMLVNKKFLRFFDYSRSIGIGVVIREATGGGLNEDGHYHKKIDQEDMALLEQGKKRGMEMLSKAGAKAVFASKIMATHMGGSLKIGNYLNSDLQTPLLGLYVCDGSIIPFEANRPPTLTLVCIAKRLARHLSS